MLDEAAAEAVRGLSRNLEFPRPAGVESGVAPHVTLAACSGLDVESFRPMAAELAARTQPLACTLASVGVFPTAEGVLFLAPTISPELVQLQLVVLQHLRQAGGEIEPYWMPGAWVAHCTVATGVPRDAIAAAVAYPDRPVYCIIGDGGLSMLMGELITIAAYKLNIKIIVIKNNTLGQIKWEQMVFLGNPEFACDLYPADFVTIARGAGINAIQIDDPATCGRQLDSVIKMNGPVLIEAVVDQFTPPMPAKIKASQAMKLAEALVRGEPNRKEIVLTNFHDKVRELV